MKKNRRHMFSLIAMIALTMGCVLQPGNPGKICNSNSSWVQVGFERTDGKPLVYPATIESITVTEFAAGSSTPTNQTTDLAKGLEDESKSYSFKPCSMAQGKLKFAASVVDGDGNKLSGEVELNYPSELEGTMKLR